MGGEGPGRRAGLRRLLAPPEPWPDEGVGAWWVRARDALGDAADPFEAALLAGLTADRVGYAFAGGYEAALWALLPDRDRTRAAALCVTESGGNHPRAIDTELAGGALRGEKAFVTLAEQAELLYVLAKVGERDGRPRLALFEVDAGAPGVALRPLPRTPFAPEIGHAAVSFDEVQPRTRLPGDGWSDHVKPFRTVEDVHVHAALLAFLVASGARWGWDHGPLERGLALLAALRTIAAADPSAPENHLALAGAIDASGELVADLEAQGWPEEDRARWDRDRALFRVASKARAARTQKAWRVISG